MSNDQIQSLASKHGFAPEAVLAAWNALQHGGGTMAQFSHRELGGAGQWIPGMLMVGDIFNHGLKDRVDALFCDLQHHFSQTPASLLEAGPSGPERVTISYQSKSVRPVTWFPERLGSPSTGGSQNNLRYAWFADSRRLAIELFGHVALYDTASHTIIGVAMDQNDDGGNITLTCLTGVIPLSTLRRIT